MLKDYKGQQMSEKFILSEAMKKLSKKELKKVQPFARVKINGEYEIIGVNRCFELDIEAEEISLFLKGQ